MVSEHREINQTIEYWEKQGIKIVPATQSDLETARLTIPEEVLELYKLANGFYWSKGNDSDADSNGFCFYSLRQFETIYVPSSKGNKDGEFSIYIFADYLSRCWFYAIKIFKGQSYEIGIMSTLKKESFKPLTNSFFNFLNLYLVDSDSIYL
jgi:hypothetical protein